MTGIGVMLRYFSTPRPVKVLIFQFFASFAAIPHISVPKKTFTSESLAIGRIFTKTRCPGTTFIRENGKEISDKSWLPGSYLNLLLIYTTLTAFYDILINFS